MKRGQVTVFVIIAILIVGSVIAYFILRGGLNGITPISSTESDAVQYFDGCIENTLKEGAAILEERGGYIYPPEFQPGNAYSPTGSQLDFLGAGVPYWYYAAGSGIVKEQIPSISDMEKQLARYIKEEIRCDLSSFASKEEVVDLQNIDYTVSIKDGSIDAEGKGSLVVYTNEKREVVDVHRVSVNSKLGKFYFTAKKIYDHELESAFLERYSLDVLRLYAPVDGVEVGCGPKVWNFNDVVNELQNGLEANVQTIRLKGNYYTLKNEQRKYFVENLAVDEDVRLLYSRDWPTKIEVYPENNGVMVAEPVGNQPGLGILGFCYAPYHFVYDVIHPVLIQIYDEKEFFQFPVVVVIDKNKERQGLVSEAVDLPATEVCNDPAQDIYVQTFDRYGNPVEASISYNCGGNLCDIGRTTRSGNRASLSGKVPQCVNGDIVAEAEGYKDLQERVDTVESAELNLVMDKLYELPVEVFVDGKLTNDTAIITFDGGDYATTVAYPYQKSVKLAEGSYNVSMQIFSEKEFNFGDVKDTKCVDVPKQGLFGFFGATEQKCFEINIPSQQLTNLLYAGGKVEDYFLDSQLRDSHKITLHAVSFGTPKTIDDLVNNFELIEIGKIDINFE